MALRLVDRKAVSQGKSVPNLEAHRQTVLTRLQRHPVSAPGSPDHWAPSPRSGDSAGGGGDASGGDGGITVSSSEGPTAPVRPFSVDSGRTYI